MVFNKIFRKQMSEPVNQNTFLIGIQKARITSEDGLGLYLVKYAAGWLKEVFHFTRCILKDIFKRRFFKESAIHQNESDILQSAVILFFYSQLLRNFFNNSILVSWKSIVHFPVTCDVSSFSFFLKNIRKLSPAEKY